MSNPNRPPFRTLTEELEELERTDPAVRAAAEKLDRVTREIVEPLLRDSIDPRRGVIDREREHGCTCDPTVSFSYGSGRVLRVAHAAYCGIFRR